jgi:transcriptional regulator with XRE-family HTH domain
MDYGRASIREFSRWLDINQAQITQWMNGKGRPGIVSARKLAMKLGPEIYDILDLPRPPKAIHELQSTYQTIPQEERQLFEQDFDRWLEDWLKSHGYKRVK